MEIAKYDRVINPIYKIGYEFDNSKRNNINKKEQIQKNNNKENFEDVLQRILK